MGRGRGRFADCSTPCGSFRPQHTLRQCRHLPKGSVDGELATHPPPASFLSQYPAAFLSHSPGKRGDLLASKNLKAQRRSLGWAPTSALGALMPWRQDVWMRLPQPAARWEAPTRNSSRRTAATAAPAHDRHAAPASIAAKLGRSAGPACLSCVLAWLLVDFVNSRSIDRPGSGFAARARGSTSHVGRPGRGQGPGRA